MYSTLYNYTFTHSNKWLSYKEMKRKLNLIVHLTVYETHSELI